MTIPGSVFEKEIAPYLEDAREVVLDFEEVEYVSSAGLRVLLATEQTLEDRDGGLRLIHVSAPIRMIFEMVGFQDILDIADD